MIERRAQAVAPAALTIGYESSTSLKLLVSMQTARKGQRKRAASQAVSIVCRLAAAASTCADMTTVTASRRTVQKVSGVVAGRNARSSSIVQRWSIAETQKVDTQDVIKL